MKFLIKICLIFTFFSLVSCSKTNSLEKMLEGKWLWSQNSRILVFKGGAMAFERTSIVFASYMVIDEETIRFIRDNPGNDYRSPSRLDMLVKVFFPTSDSMIWQREVNGKLQDWWHFERIK